MKKKKKIIIAVCVVAVAAIGVVSLLNGNRKGAAVSVPYAPLSKTSLRSTISASGVVQSNDSVNIYSDLNYAVKKINVKVGDRVSAGQVLCEIDSVDLQNSINQKIASIQTSAAQSNQRIKTSQKKYSDTKSNLSAGLNTQINSAADKVVSAQRDLETAQQKLTDAKKRLDTNTDSSLISAKSAVETARLDYESADKSYNDFKKDHKGEDISGDLQDESRKLREAMESAKVRYDAAKASLAAYYTTHDESIADLTKAVTTAQISYDSAVKAQKAAIASVNQDLIAAADSITSEKLSADQKAQQTELESLQTKLAKCSVTAPTSGTITAVYATENAPSGGLMFVIEDINALEMKIKIKESDIASVKPGMKAVVSADAIDGKKFDGVVGKISPTSLKDKEGKTVSSSNAEFEADITITSKDPALLIGMNGSAEIILQSKESVYSVPVDAVTTDPQGKDIIYSAVQQQDGSYKAVAVPVTLGIETDTNVEVSGSDLKDGLKIITDPKQTLPNQKIILEPNENEGTRAPGKKEAAGA